MPRARQSAARWPIVIALAVFVLLGAFVVAARLTDRSSYCGSCHEMAPFHTAWSSGSHAEKAECIDCHVEQGFLPRLGHKFVALRELEAHFTGDTLFPRSIPASVPEDRCVRCHQKIRAKPSPYFDHAAHAKKGTCAGCHYDAGHSVTATALAEAGILNEATLALRSIPPTKAAAAPGRGRANLPGHKSMSCSRCHDLARTGCPACHVAPTKPPHKQGQDCSICHKPGTKFTFAHPSAGECAECHEPKHADFGTCTICHRKPGVNWAFTHGAATRACERCHKPKHQNRGTCTTCHKRPGVSWAFRHPSAGEHSWRSQPCKACHPKSYRAVSCTCHGGGRPVED